MMGTVSLSLRPLRKITHTRYNFWVDASVKGVYLGIVKCCRCEGIFNSRVNDTDVCHCDELSTHIC